jgi:hypothetical protein
MPRWIHLVDLLLEHWSRVGVAYFISGFVFCSPLPNCEAEANTPLAFRALISAALDGVNAFGLDGVSKIRKIYAAWARRYQKIDRLADSPFPIPSTSLLQFKLRASGMYFSRPQIRAFARLQADGRKARMMRREHSRYTALGR